MRIALLVLLSFAATAKCSLSVCDDESCTCDAHSRLICDCNREFDEVTIRPEGPYKVPSSLTAILVNGCSRLFFLPDSISNLNQLRSVELRNVKHIYFSEMSMLWSPYSRSNELIYPGIKILIDNSTINELQSHTFKGRIDNIEIRNSKIEIIRPYAFSSLSGLKTIELYGNHFDNIELQAFKKFTLERFIISGGSIKSTPSRMLSDIEVSDIFRIDRVNIGDMASMSFIVTDAQKTAIENNVIGTVEGDTFHLISRGPVLFRNNTIGLLKQGALMGITTNTKTLNSIGKQELLIDNNTINEANAGSFVYNRMGLTLRMDGLNLNKECECEEAASWMGLVASYGGTISCWSPMEGHFVSVATYINNRCGSFRQSFWLFIVLAVFLAFLGAAIIICLVVRRENEKKKKLQIVMPDGKTYRETELHIIVERAELLTTDL